MEQEIKLQYKVKDIFKETPDVSTLFLENPKGEMPPYKAGQYIVAYFPDTAASQGKAYTMSSAPSEKKFAISVKAMGGFSNRLCALTPGDEFTASQPYGYFYSESQDAPLVLIAAGIGVTPFRSMIVDAVGKNPSREIALFYSNRTLADIAFKKEFDDLAALHPRFRVHHFITRERTALPGVVHDRISGEKIMGEISGMADADFLICGSVAFVRDIWRDLRARGVSEDAICTEAFFSH